MKKRNQYQDEIVELLDGECEGDLHAEINNWGDDVQQLVDILGSEEIGREQSWHLVEISQDPENDQADLTLTLNDQQNREEYFYLQLHPQLNRHGKLLYNIAKRLLGKPIIWLSVEELCEDKKNTNDQFFYYIQLNSDKFTTAHIYGQGAFLPINSYKQVRVVAVKSDRVLLHSLVTHYEIALSQYESPFGIEELYEVSAWIFGQKTKLWMCVSKEEAWDFFNKLKCSNKKSLDCFQAQDDFLDANSERGDDIESKYDRPWDGWATPRIQISKVECWNDDRWEKAYVVTVWRGESGWPVLRTRSQKFAWVTFFELSPTLDEMIDPEF